MVSLERLVRFKRPFQKKSRVYRDILIKNSIYPKISLKNYFNYSPGIIEALVQLIWNTSVKHINGGKNNEMDNELKNRGISEYELNFYLAYEDLKTFYPKILLEDIFFSENLNKFSKPSIFFSQFEEENTLKNQIRELFDYNFFQFDKNLINLNGFDILSRGYFLYNLSFPLDLSGLLDFIEKNEPNLPVGIKRLVYINKLLKSSDLCFENIAETMDKIYLESEKYREREESRYPAKLILLVEGATEEKLLPIFAKKMGMDFFKKGVELISSAGKIRWTNFIILFIK